VDVIDTVNYQLPLGVIGMALHTVWVKPRLDEIFRFRYNALAHYFDETSNERKQNEKLS